MPAPPKRKSGGDKKSAKHAKSTPATPAEPKLSRLHKPEELALEEWQLLLRRQFGTQQDFLLENLGDDPLFSDYRLTNPATGRSYRLVIRGARPGDNYCSCPDYRINGLGSCKHIEFTLAKLRKKRGATTRLKTGYQPSFSEVVLTYGLRREVRFRPGTTAPPGLIRLAARYFTGDGSLKERRLLELPSFLQAAGRYPEHELRCRDDVMAFIAEHQDAAHRRSLLDTELPEGIDSPLFETLLKTRLYPYQRQGALFAARAGRCLIGDDMGLGKTIQAIAAAELMARLFGVAKVLVVAPTSLKHQWQGEIEKFAARSVAVIEGLNAQRAALYRNESFYKLVNYELIHRDARFIREWGPDLIILDEAQRIKNWQTRTAKSVKELESTFAIVLTGTPIENRIEELHSIMEFVDRHHLGPLYRFVHQHRVTDAGGKLVGYQNLETVRKSLASVMIRRKKGEVLRQLPGRVDKTFLVDMTPEQRAIHDEFSEMVSRLVLKWRRQRFLCEADQRRLQMALASMRMAADNTYLVDKTTNHGPKLEELDTLLGELVIQGGEKVVIFSQWILMNRLVEEILTRNGIGYVHLNGSVPSKARKALMERFREDPACRVFLSTDAGGVGLNLQSGSVVINMDIPWNPAVLEQRIARIHRMGQKRNVRVVNFVSRDSIEERILDLLRFKSSLAAGALDAGGEDTVILGPSQLERFMESVEEATAGLERRDPAQEQRNQEEAERAAAEAAVASAEAEDKVAAPVVTVAADPLRELLLGGARLLAGLGEALAQPPGSHGEKPSKPLGLAIERDEATGRNTLRIPLPEPEVVQSLVAGLGQLLAALTPPPR